MPPQKKKTARPPRAKLPPAAFARFLVAPPDRAEPDDCDDLEASRAVPPEWAEVERVLAAAKARLDPHAGDPALGEALRGVDLLAGLRRTIRLRFRGQAVTNAWLKMYELASALGLVPRAQVAEGEGALLRVFCNAELPGAFVCALNHLVCTRHPGTRLEWVASSLYPGEEEEGGGAGDVLGDAYGLYARNPGRWLMSAKMRGDVTDPADIWALAAAAKTRLGAVDLYTSDAGIEVSGDYARQEQSTARIHLGQTLVGLMSLRRGGALVAKTYTFVHPASVSLLAVCAEAFDELLVTKPAASRPANSEVYVVGLGFRGLAAAQRARLLAAVADFDVAAPLVPLAGPAWAGTVASLLEAARALHQRQQPRYLAEAVEYYRAFRGAPRGALRAALRGDAERAQAAWLRRYPVAPLAPDCRLAADEEEPRP